MGVLLLPLSGRWNAERRRAACGADPWGKGTPMLGEHPIHPVLLATDLAAARASTTPSLASRS